MSKQSLINGCLRKPDNSLIAHVKQGGLNKKQRRMLVFVRDNFRCQYVGCKVRSVHQLEVHHIVPTSQGGGHHSSNMITLCRKHHGQVHGTTYGQIPPVPRRRIQPVFLPLRDGCDQAWVLAEFMDNDFEIVSRRYPDAAACIAQGAHMAKRTSLPFFVPDSFVDGHELACVPELQP